MSELTQCNYCSLEIIKREAQHDKQKITLVPSSHQLKGLDVYVHPRDINIHLLHKQKKQSYWVCWFWAIGAKCEC